MTALRVFETVSFIALTIIAILLITDTLNDANFLLLALVIVIILVNFVWRIKVHKKS
ncbi:hypothetical protein HNR44_001540 [Geomicrobium halophilum]|uniref:Uncharacterized protein n=1 Tax=Geomicrobium halophilum TaxID=549000 RepID=A0A841PTG1_9BACL|nr:hypothetical protein [Geomicrobium halophilum]MBB6449591.1 hypothetical protein [Geomicrobium halophilum]